MDYMIFNVRTEINICDCTRGCTDTVREPTLTVDSGTEIPCRTGESNLPQRRAGPTLDQLIYIPLPDFVGYYKLQPFAIAFLRSLNYSFSPQAF